MADAGGCSRVGICGEPDTDADDIRPGTINCLTVNVGCLDQHRLDPRKNCLVISLANHVDIMRQQTLGQASKTSRAVQGHALEAEALDMPEMSGPGVCSSAKSCIWVPGRVRQWMWGAP
jgi:hypothetical protein